MRRAQLNFTEFFDLLALPNDPAVPEDIRKNADRVERAFGARSFTTRQLPNDGRPLVFAEYSSSGAAANTVLFYMHFDGMPVIDSRWSQKSPFVAEPKASVNFRDLNQLHYTVGINCPNIVGASPGRRAPRTIGVGTERRGDEVHWPRSSNAEAG